MKINAKRKARRKAGALHASYSKNCNYIIKHAISIVKYKRRASPMTNYELIKSFDLEQMAHFLVNFRRVFDRVYTIELAKKILESEAVI